MLNKQIAKLLTKRNLLVFFSGVLAVGSLLLIFWTVIFTNAWQEGDQNARKVLLCFMAFPVIFGVVPELKNGTGAARVIFVLCCLWIAFWAGGVSWGYGPTL
ncbi:MAG: hypothetical protein AAB438_02030 [Patescibacteria group bacterium]